MCAIVAGPAEAHFGNGAGLARQIAAEKFSPSCEPAIGRHVPDARARLGHPPLPDRPGGGMARLGFRSRCSALVHEYGHLAGSGTPTTPLSVMFSELTIFSPVRAAPRPAALRAGVDGHCWARTSDLRLVEAALSQLS